MHTETVHSHGVRIGCGTLNAGSQSPFSLLSIMKIPQHPEKSPSLSDPPKLLLPRLITELSEAESHQYFDVVFGPRRRVEVEGEGGGPPVVSAQRVADE